jgi:hypothetical protein
MNAILIYINIDRCPLQQNNHLRRACAASAAGMIACKQLISSGEGDD